MTRCLLPFATGSQRAPLPHNTPLPPPLPRTPTMIPDADFLAQLVNHETQTCIMVLHRHALGLTTAAPITHAPITHAPAWPPTHCTVSVVIRHTYQAADMHLPHACCVHQSLLQLERLTQ
jgi:hypothetical protein